MRKLSETIAAHRRVAGLLVILVAAISAGFYLESRQSRLTVGPGAGEKGPAPAKPSAFVYPTFGYDAARTRYLPSSLDPPFKTVWRAKPTGQLLEFPPSLGDGRLYVVDNLGRALGISAQTGKTLWSRRLGALAASTPAYDGGRVYTTILCQSTCSTGEYAGESNGVGRVVALDASNGRTLWSRDLSGRSESSPLVLGDRVYFGTESGKVYALRKSDGRVVWTYQAKNAVKSGLAYDNGRLFFGDYAGSVSAVRVRDGKLVWTRSHVSSENFYGTPAVGFGHVYLSTTDGVLFALSEDGNVDWQFQAGPEGYFYSSPALDAPRGLGPTVYIGSHDQHFYAIDARTGTVRWSNKAAGPILGSAAIIGDNVYYSTLSGAMTYGVRARDGREVFSRRQGAFDPAIADERNLYLIGYSTITALAPQGQHGAARAAPGGGRGGR